MRKSDRELKDTNTSQPAYSLPDQFHRLSLLFQLERYFIYYISYAITQLSFVLTAFLVISFFQHKHLFNRNSNK